MTQLMTQLQETANFIKSKVNESASTAIILGSGLGNLASKIEVDFEISYKEIPHFPVSTVEGHKGRLVLGKLNGKKVWVNTNYFYPKIYPAGNNRGLVLSGGVKVTAKVI